MGQKTFCFLLLRGSNFLKEGDRVVPVRPSLIGLVKLKAIIEFWSIRSQKLRSFKASHRVGLQPPPAPCLRYWRTDTSNRRRQKFEAGIIFSAPIFTFYPYFPAVLLSLVKRSKSPYVLASLQIAVGSK